MLTREELNEYRKLTTERKALERKAKVMEEREKAIVAKAHAELTAAGKNQITRYGFVLLLEPGRVNVSWKEAFIEQCGASAASKLQEKAAKAAEDDKKAKIIAPAA